MPYDSGGNYSLPNGYLAVTGQKVLASQHNPPLEDIGSGLSLTLLRDGRAPMLADLNMNGYTLTGLGESDDADAPALNRQITELKALIRAVSPPGLVGLFRLKTAPQGWVTEGGTIGSAASGATNRANSDTFILYDAVWTNFSNTELVIQNSAGADSTRGVSALSDFNANKRMPLFDPRSRFPRAWDGGLGWDATLTIGAAQADVLKSHIHTGTTDSAGAHTHTSPTGTTGGGNAAQTGPQTGNGITTGSAGAHTHPFTTDATGNSLETRPRSSVYLFCIKL